MEATKRIDKGIKRGPRNKQNPISPKADLGTWVIPPGLNPKEVLDRYLTAETTGQIAAQYGLSRKALVRWLRQEVPEEWKSVQIIRALCRKDDGDEGLEVASDALSLARAREQLKSAQFDLERLDSNTWGQRTHIDVATQPLSAVDTELLGSARELLTLFKAKLAGVAPALQDRSQVIDVQSHIEEKPKS